MRQADDGLHQVVGQQEVEHDILQVDGGEVGGQQEVEQDVRQADDGLHQVVGQQEVEHDILQVDGREVGLRQVEPNIVLKPINSQAKNTIKGLNEKQVEDKDEDEDKPILSQTEANPLHHSQAQNQTNYINQDEDRLSVVGDEKMKKINTDIHNPPTSVRLMNLRPPPKSLMKAKRVRRKPKVIPVSPTKGILRFVTNKKGVLTETRDGTGQMNETINLHISGKTDKGIINCTPPPRPRTR